MNTATVAITARRTALLTVWVIVLVLLAGCDSSVPSPTDSPTGSVAPLPFQLPESEQLSASPKKVFAHYLPSFPLSLDNKAAGVDYYDTEYLNPAGENGKHAAYGGLLRDRPLPQTPLDTPEWQLENMKTEVRRANEAGLDGFIIDVLSLDGDNWDRVNLLFRAAASVDPTFKLVLMPDAAAADLTDVDALADAMASLATSPAAFRLADGRVVVSPFHPERLGPAYWETFLRLMSNRGVTVAFVPCFLDYESSVSAFARISYGFSNWGSRSPAANQGLAANIHDAHGRGKIWMQPVSVQDVRPSQGVYDEANNSENLRLSWQGAIDDGADWVQIATWNDYSESTEVSPSQYGGWTPLDLSAYYLTRFKTGGWPAIVRDVVYVSYRTQPSAAMASNGQQTVMTLRRGSSPARDKLEVLSFLTAPATIEASVGGVVHSYSASAGVNAQLFDLKAGNHSVTVVRDGRPVVSVSTPFATTLTPTVQSLQYFFVTSGRTGTYAPAQAAGNPPRDGRPERRSGRA